MKGNKTMSRQITEIIVRAFMNDETKRMGNSEVRTDFVTTKLYLWNNLIAIKKKDTGKIEVSMAGYPTVTTRERLNGIPGVSISQRKGIQYLNGKEIDTDKFYAVN